MESYLEDRYIRFDWAIKRLLRQKANFGVLEGFLTVFLREKVTIMEILESESNQHARTLLSGTHSLRSGQSHHRAYLAGRGILSCKEDLLHQHSVLRHRHRQ